MRILNLILDGEVTKEEEEFFYSHIEGCIVCFSHFNLEKQMRELLKSKVQKKRVPSELAIEIRNRIIQ